VLIAFWIAYLSVFTAGVLFLLMHLFARAWSDVPLPHLLSFLYCYGVLGLAYALEGISPLAFAAVLLLSPVAVFAVKAGRRRHGVDSHRRDLSERLTRLKAFFAKYPTDGATLGKIGDIYAALGETALAEMYLERGRAIYAKDPIKADPLERKLKWLRRGRPDMPDQAIESLEHLRACPQCEDVNLRAASACVACRAPLGTVGTDGLLAAVQRFLENRAVFSVVVSGALCFPFIYVCGELPYGALWAVWGAGLFLAQRRSLSFD
jgi:hypothetical protein